MRSSVCTTSRVSGFPRHYKTRKEYLINSPRQRKRAKKFPKRNDQSTIINVSRIFFYPRLLLGSGGRKIGFVLLRKGVFQKLKVMLVKVRSAGPKETTDLIGFYFFRGQITIDTPGLLTLLQACRTWYTSSALIQGQRYGPSEYQKLEEYILETCFRGMVSMN